jgi:S-adenosylmethionine:tRNA ribosyltransferase-isomerase
MMSREDQLSTYDYFLPDELIAKVPLPARDGSRLMVLDRNSQSIAHRSIRDLPALLQSGDCLVLNNSRVLPARMFGVRTKTGGKWEGLYLNSSPEGHWRLIGQTRGYLKPGETISIRNASDELLQLTLIDREGDGVSRFEASPSGNTLDLLTRFGTVPLPPYMDRKQATDNDWERYQTTYARHPGSIAAPTAGLHFTPELLEACKQRGISRAEVTLHVGVGTFRPVSVENLAEHQMHSEWCEITSETAGQLSQTRAGGGRVVAVGTTSLRTLESAYRSIGDHPSKTPASMGNSEMPKTGFHEWRGETRLFIRPPYSFRSADVLLTNFHLPHSTLLMLVAAFAGLDFILDAYRTAVDERYRFFSYGDAMLIL